MASLPILRVQQQVPDSTTRPIYPTTLSAWLETLGAYNTCEGNDRLLDLYRVLWDSNAYYPYLMPFPNNISTNLGLKDPNGFTANFQPGETQTGSIQIPVDSFLVSIGAVTYGGPGFQFRIYDKATQSDLFYGQFAFYRTAGSPGDQDRTAADQPFGPYILNSPFIISDPGILQIEITNLDTVNNETIQILLSFGCPQNNVSMSKVAVKEG